MIAFTTTDINEYVDFNMGSDFVIGYSRALESFDDYLDKAMIDVSCEDASNTQGTSLWDKIKKIVETVINFFKSLLNKLKEFIKKYADRFRKKGKEYKANPNPKNSIKDHKEPESKDVRISKLEKTGQEYTIDSGSFRYQNSPGEKPGQAKYKRLQLFDVLQAAPADHLVLILNQLAPASAESAV